MTNTSAVVLALSLLINGITVLYKSSGPKEDYFSSKLVFLLGITLLLREVSLFPSLVRTKFQSICFLLEIPLSLLLLECSIIYIWQLIQDYVLQHTDDLLVFLSSDDRLEWLVCHFCCGREAITQYYCTCVSGRRTVGCCAHVMSIVWYLGWARYEDNIRPPAQFLDDILLCYDSE